MSESKEFSFWELIEDQNLASRRLVLVLEEELQDILDDISRQIWNVYELLDPIKGIPNVDKAKELLAHLYQLLEKEG
jgi:hypothetical protein